MHEQRGAFRECRKSLDVVCMYRSASPRRCTAAVQLNTRFMVVPVQQNGANSNRHSRRGDHGRFISERIRLESDTENRRRKKDRERIVLRIFEWFLRVFFISGTSKDWIPTSSRSGCLVEAYEAVLKSAFQVKRFERARRTKRLYLRASRSGKEAVIKRIWVSDARFPGAGRSKVEVFKFRRVPSIERDADEMNSLREWVHFAFTNKALKGSISEAMDALEAVISSYRYVNDFGSYVGFPCRRNGRHEVDEHSEHSNRTNSALNASGGSRGSDTGQVNSALTAAENRVPRSIEPGRDGESAALGDSGTPEEDVGVSSVGLAGISPDDARNRSSREKLLGQVLIFFDAALNDKIYLMLSLPFMSELDSGFDLVAAGFRSKLGTRDPIVPPLVRELLTFCYWRHFKVLDEEKHRKRQKLLRTLQEMFTMARQAFGLKTVDDLLFSFRRLQPVSPSRSEPRCINCATEIHPASSIPQRSPLLLSPQRTEPRNREGQENDQVQAGPVPDETIANERAQRNADMVQAGLSTRRGGNEEEQPELGDGERTGERLQVNEMQDQSRRGQDLSTNREQQTISEGQEANDRQQSGEETQVQGSGANGTGNEPIQSGNGQTNGLRANEQSHPRRTIGHQSEGESLYEMGRLGSSSPFSNRDRIQQQTTNADLHLLRASQNTSGPASCRRDPRQENEEVHEALQDQRMQTQNMNARALPAAPTVPQDSRSGQLQQPSFQSFQNYERQDMNLMSSFQDFALPPLQATRVGSLYSQESCPGQGSGLPQTPLYALNFAEQLHAHGQHPGIERAQESYVWNLAQGSNQQRPLPGIQPVHALTEEVTASAALHQLQGAQYHP